MKTLVLGIETSCDETSVAVVADGKEILSVYIVTVPTYRDGKAAEGSGEPEDLPCRRKLCGATEICIGDLQTGQRKLGAALRAITLEGFFVGRALSKDLSSRQRKAAAEKPPSRWGSWRR